jgi:hypothetical protein
MKTMRIIVMALMALSLAACLEVEQHPPWLHGYYDGKPDNMAFQRNFHGDRLAWNAAIDNRNRRQNEYTRMP